MSNFHFISQLTRPAHRHGMWQVSVWLAIPIVLLAACGSAGAEPATPRPTNTPFPIITPTLPPTVTPQPTALPTASPQIVSTFAPDVDPLTGEKVSDPTVLNRRPLEIVIANSNEAGVRPQSGTSSADWVFEYETEAPGITRWSAIFYSRTPNSVGSDRSCRIIDTELPAIFKSLLVCSGMSGGTHKFYIDPADFTLEGRTFSQDYGDDAPLFYRTTTAVPPHNLFVNPAEVWKAADKRGVNTRPDLSGLSFAPQPLASRPSAKSIGLTYHSSSIDWEYAASVNTCSSFGGCYLRWNDGAPHTDALNGQQIGVANMIVIYVNYTQDVRYLEEDYGALKLFGWQIQLWGNPGGDIKIFRDGQEFDGKWSRPARADMLSFKDVNGQVIPLKPGNTWVELVPWDGKVNVTP